MSLPFIHFIVVSSFPLSLWLKNHECKSLSSLFIITFSLFIPTLIISDSSTTSGTSIMLRYHVLRDFSSAVVTTKIWWLFSHSTISITFELLIDFLLHSSYIYFPLDYFELSYACSFLSQSSFDILSFLFLFVLNRYIT